MGTATLLYFRLLGAATVKVYVVLAADECHFHFWARDVSRRRNIYAYVLSPHVDR